MENKEVFDRENSHEIDSVQRVKQYIYRQMETQQLSEGDRLPSEIALSNQLHVPRNLVRDALQSLKGVGLLNSVRGSGYVLTPNFDYSLAEVLHAMMSVSNISRKDINEVRLALERKAIELIIKNNIQEQEFSAMERQVRVMEQNSILGSTGRVNPRACVEADKEFHRMLAIISGNTFIRAFNISLNQYYDGYVALQWERLSVEESFQLVEAHKNILKYLKKVNQDKALTALEYHYNFVAGLMKKLYETDTEELKEIQNLVHVLLKKGFTGKQIQEKLRELEELLENPTV